MAACCSREQRLFQIQRHDAEETRPTSCTKVLRRNTPTEFRCFVHACALKIIQREMQRTPAPNAKHSKHKLRTNHARIITALVSSSPPSLPSKPAAVVLSAADATW